MDELRRLIVDGRAVDHPTARNRGVGRQTLGMLSGLRQVGAPLTVLVDTDAEATILTDAMPGIEVARWSPGEVARQALPGSWFLSTQLMLHPIPLDAVPRVITESGLPVAAVMHDVIPERYPAQYQAHPTPRAQVQLRGMLTRTLDALLAVSTFAADTAAHELRFPRDRIRVIGAGVDGAFQIAAAPPWDRVARVLPNDGRGVVLMVSGGDARKNTERMLAAWGVVPAAVRRSHRLVVAAAANDATLGLWQMAANTARVGDEVTFTGGVTDEEMVALHQVAKLAIMPSVEEGFGLPVLEAAACGCPVIVSNVSSLPEVLGEPRAEFDPWDTSSIASTVERALTDIEFRRVLLAAGERAVRRWTWANTGQAVVDSLAELGPRQHRELRAPRSRLALVGRFDESDEGVANEALASAIHAVPTAPEVHLLVQGDGRTSPISSVPHRSSPARFPARALGRYVHRSLFDEIVEVALVDGRPSLLSSAGTTLTLPVNPADAASAALEWVASLASDRS